MNNNNYLSNKKYYLLLIIGTYCYYWSSNVIMLSMKKQLCSQLLNTCGSTKHNNRQDIIKVLLKMTVLKEML